MDVTRLEHRCPKCAELWGVYGSTARQHAELIEEQRSIAAISPERSWLLDPLIEAAERRRKPARAAVEFHRVLLHGKAPRIMTASQAPVAASATIIESCR
jgi:hypothetical protein